MSHYDRLADQAMTLIDALWDRRLELKPRQSSPASRHELRRLNTLLKRAQARNHRRVCLAEDMATVEAEVLAEKIAAEREHWAAEDDAIAFALSREDAAGYFEDALAHTTLAELPDHEDLPW